MTLEEEKLKIKKLETQSTKFKDALLHPGKGRSWNRWIPDVKQIAMAMWHHRVFEQEEVDEMLRAEMLQQQQKAAFIKTLSNKSFANINIMMKACGSVRNERLKIKLDELKAKIKTDVPFEEEDLLSVEMLQIRLTSDWKGPPVIAVVADQSTSTSAPKTSEEILAESKAKLHLKTEIETLNLESLRDKLKNIESEEVLIGQEDNEGQTTLHACLNRATEKVECLELLLDRFETLKGQKKLKDYLNCCPASSKQTVAHVAAENSMTPVLLKLYERGCDFFRRNSQNQTAIELMYLHSPDAVLEILNDSVQRCENFDPYKEESEIMFDFRIVTGNETTESGSEKTPTTPAGAKKKETGDKPATNRKNGSRWRRLLNCFRACTYGINTSTPTTLVETEVIEMEPLDNDSNVAQIETENEKMNVNDNKDVEVSLLQMLITENKPGAKLILPHAVVKCFLEFKWRELIRWFRFFTVIGILFHLLFVIFVYFVFASGCPYGRVSVKSIVWDSFTTVASGFSGKKEDVSKVVLNMTNSVMENEPCYAKGSSCSCNNMSERLSIQDSVIRLSRGLIDVNKLSVENGFLEFANGNFTCGNYKMNLTNSSMFITRGMLSLQTGVLKINQGRLNTSESTHILSGTLEISDGFLEAESQSCDISSWLIGCCWIFLVGGITITVNEIWELGIKLIAVTQSKTGCTFLLILKGLKVYFCSERNILQILNVICLLLMNPWSMRTLDNWEYAAASIGVIVSGTLILMEVAIYIENIGKYYQILRRVLKKILMLMAFYVFFIVSFAVSFMVIGPNINPFKTLPLSIVKLLAMMEGELDYNETFYGDNHEPPIPIVGHIVFIIFAILMTFVLMNLLIGLVVHDVKELEDSADVYLMCMRIDQIFLMQNLKRSSIIKCLKWCLKRLKCCVGKGKGTLSWMKNHIERISSWLSCCVKKGTPSAEEGTLSQMKNSIKWVLNWLSCGRCFAEEGTPSAEEGTPSAKEGTPSGIKNRIKWFLNWLSTLRLMKNHIKWFLNWLSCGIFCVEEGTPSGTKNRIKDVPKDLRKRIISIVLNGRDEIWKFQSSADEIDSRNTKGA